MIAKFGAFEYALAHRYRFGEIVGRGGMGTVYRAADAKLNRPVAIKMLHRELTSEVGIKRFETEIRITAALNHPSIVVLHDCGEVDGRLYYVMEFLDGESLRSRIAREGRLTIQAAVATAEQVAAGLQFAHQRNVVHRDIKPENIILANDRVCIVDFGLARIVNDSGSKRLTASGLIVGTPQYLSPEQAGAEKNVGPSADQYALACVLYEMLTGEPPFTGQTAAAIATKHVRELPLAVDRRRREVPRALAETISRALSKQPGERFASVADFMRSATFALRSDGMSDPRDRVRRRTSFEAP